jgi:hypothetical protein
MEGRLTIYALYDHPLDYPDNYVIRRYFVWAGGKSGVEETPFHLDTSLDGCRLQMVALGLYRLPRDPSDDPKIIESWI